MSDVYEKTFPNAGPGPDELSLRAIAGREDVDAIILLLQRDYLCSKCRKQVRTVAAQYEAFRSAGAEVVAVLPEPKDRVVKWVTSYDLPFPFFADPETVLGDALEQPVRFGLLGKAADLIGRMPEAALFDARNGSLELVNVHRGKYPADRPSVEQLLEWVEDLEREDAD